MVVEDNTFKCGFCVEGESKKILVGPRTYKQSSNRPCSTCILPLMLVLNNPQEIQVKVPKDVKGWEV